MSGWILWVSMAQAQVVCEDGVAHAHLTEALADARCTDLRVEAGVHEGRVVVGRSVSIVGAGAASTWLVCDEGPCLSVLPGVELELHDVTLAAEGAALSSWQADLTVEGVVFTRIGRRGGWVRLRDTHATFADIDVDVSVRAPIQIEALSTRGHDLAFDTARFFGHAPASGTKSAIYTIGYSVDCRGCSFLPERARPRPPEPRSVTDAPATGLAGREARWPQLWCPAASDDQWDQCRGQCAADEELATCRMSWNEAAAACEPVAVCVPVGEAVGTVPLTP